MKINSEVSIIGFPYTATENSGRGIDRYVKILSDNLNRLKVNFQLIDDGIVHADFWRIVFSAPKILLRIYKSKSNVYHAVDPIGTLLLALLFKSPTITTIHDTIPISSEINGLGLRMIFLRRLMKFSLNFSSKIIVPFEVTKDELITKFQVNPEKIFVVNYGFDFPDLVQKGNSVIDRKNFKILFMGGGTPIPRGLNMVLETYLRLKNLKENIQLTLVGNSKKIISALKILPGFEQDGNVEILDFIPEGNIYAFISNYDVFIYPSSLGFSYLVVQAMYSGVPTVVANSRDMLEYVGIAGICCPPGDLLCFVREIERIITDETYKNEFKNEGIKKAQSLSGFSMAKRSKEVYDLATEEMIKSR